MPPLSSAASISSAYSVPGSCRKRWGNPCPIEAMITERNPFGQPIGRALEGWTARALPPLTPMVGRYCSIEKLDAERHAADLYAAFSETPDGRDWTYSLAGPFS